MVHGEDMGRSLIMLCAGFGTLVGGFLPVLWGNNGMGLAGVGCAALGGVAGLWLGVRLSD
jgi:hypothetical protein